jgi:hypothetical protein
VSPCLEPRQPAHAFLVDVVTLGKIDDHILPLREGAVVDRFDYRQRAVVEIPPYLQHVSPEADVGMRLLPFRIGDGQRRAYEHGLEQVQKKD